MSQAHLLIKYKNKLLCEMVNNRIDFINVPPYSKIEAFTNVSVFIALLLNGLLEERFNSKKSFNFLEWEEKFDKFNPEVLYQLDGDTYIYDIDELLKSYDDSEAVKYLDCLPSNLKWFSIPFLHELSLDSKKREDDDFNEDEKYTYSFLVDDNYLSLKLDEWISFLDIKRSEKDVLLLYSGGKDSTLSAIRLNKLGYNVHFIHYDNGCMRDTDKPYLTFRKSFKVEEGFYFSYVNKCRDIGHLVRNYQSRYSLSDLSNVSLDSEYACMSCRMAMYTDAVKYAKDNGFKFIADGARASQEFMLEQSEFLEHLSELAGDYGITLLFPVLDIVDQQSEISEIINSGYSAKTWESKCLIGKPSFSKSEEDKTELISYYEKCLKKTMRKLIDL